MCFYSHFLTVMFVVSGGCFQTNKQNLSIWLRSSIRNTCVCARFCVGLQFCAERPNEERNRRRSELSVHRVIDRQRERELERELERERDPCVSRLSVSNDAQNQHYNQTFPGHSNALITRMHLTKLQPYIGHIAVAGRGKWFCTSNPRQLPVTANLSYIS